MQRLHLGVCRWARSEIRLVCLGSLGLRDRVVDILIGSINIMAPATALAGILTFAWPYAKSESQLIAIVTFYGYE